MPDLDTYGYEPGLLSNSMLQTAICCPLKYKLIYIDKVDPYKGQKVYGAAWAGNVVHKIIELHDDTDNLITPLLVLLSSLFSPEVAQRTGNLMALYSDARAATMEYGKRWGNTYKAPEMTGFWKKTYSGVDQLLAKLDQDIPAAFPGIWEESYSELMKRVYVSLNNWPKMRIAPAIASEKKLKSQVRLVMMAGTADRLENRPNGTALCDIKSGKWGYDEEKVSLLDQLGLYDHFLLLEDYDVIEWTIYNTFLGTVTQVIPTDGIRAAYRYRLTSNLRYFDNLDFTSDYNEQAVDLDSIGCKSCPFRGKQECKYTYVS